GQMWCNSATRTDSDVELSVDWSVDRSQRPFSQQWSDSTAGRCSISYTARANPEKSSWRRLAFLDFLFCPEPVLVRRAGRAAGGHPECISKLFDLVLIRDFVRGSQSRGDGICRNTIRRQYLLA